MKMTELQEILGKRIEITLETKLSPEERKTIIENTKIIAVILKLILNKINILKNIKMI